MAKLYPERLPVSIQEDPKRRAECNVFGALRTLPNPYVVFYSIHWQTVSVERGMREGEADFIIAHPEKGVIVLEVKGGGIRFSAEEGRWYSRDSYGIEHEIKDPVAQGSHNAHQLLNQLRGLPEWPGRYLNISNAVCFPDIYVPKGQVLRPDLRRELILDHDDMEDIHPAIERMFATLFAGNSGAPGSDGMRVIEGYLARSFELRTPLGVELEAEEERLIHLTEDQFRILSFLGDRKRAAISGCAGSGKTMLAVRKAQQFASLGLNTLLVCFNIPLAEDLAKRLPNVDVDYFHGLCKRAANEVGFTLRGGDLTKDEYYDDVLPQALFDAAGEIGQVYDAIIVDEGQDFREEYWMAMEPLLKDNGYLYIFFDNNQNIYSRSADFGGLIKEDPFPLNRNCRNTQMIHQLVAKFHNNPESLWAEGPQGRTPEILEYRGEEDMLRQLQKLLHRLVNEERVDCEDMVILTPRGEERSRLKAGSRLGMFTLSSIPSKRANTVQVTSVHRFKGLERRLVILTEVDARTKYSTDMVMYVGCSRARTHLVILHDVEAPSDLIERLSKKK